jgi:hypothetical protein
MYIAVRGGLGNQMFQVAHAIALKARFKRMPKLVDLTNDARVARTWQMSGFSIEKATINKISVALILWVILVISKLRNLGLPICKKILIESSDYSLQDYDTCPLLVSGYWQKPAYFEEVEAAVRQTFRLPLRSPAKVLSLKDSCPIVAIHLRRGDYAFDPIARAAHLVCDENWYVGAWQAMKDMFPTAIGLVFSDDPNWARACFSDEKEIFLASSQEASSPLEDLALMSACDHFIISNSSFSWWAAWLNESEEKAVMAPREWFPGVATESLRICPSNWILR